ncbi:MAG: LacI family DNA-binding transcriptional regulator [Lentisphaeria bacterium]|nr:LacI family DNA-binding transcriptional regulator [Lentisphaeria bacterium]
MISMKEIGKICGVAESTVSKALRGHAGIKQATRERVAEVARKYGYQPNAMVECMQTGKSRSIGIACNNFQCMFTGAVMDGIHKTLHDYGYDSYVICWDKLVKDGIDLLSRFARRRVDGLLLLPMGKLPELSHISQLHTFHNPVVLVDQVWRGADFDYVGSDNRGGMAALVERLIASGRKKIGAVFFTEVSTGEERRAGFLDAMFRHNMPVDARFLCEVSDARSSYDEIRRVLDAKERPDALVCFNDYLANDALNAAFDLGIGIPEELAVTGFGNLPLCEKLRPMLTTVDQHAYKIGQAAARQLMERITGNETGPFRAHLVPTEPVIRQSCIC